MAEKSLLLREYLQKNSLKLKDVFGLKVTKRSGEDMYIINVDGLVPEDALPKYVFIGKRADDRTGWCVDAQDLFVEPQTQKKNGGFEK